jgi:pimeloyl-ACP methyl ester carboxylesterase
LGTLDARVSALARGSGIGSGTGDRNVPVVTTHNTRIDYDVRGAGPALVLINGLGFGRWGFFKQVPALSRHFATITFDARGERDREGVVGGLAGDVVDLLGHLGVNRAHVLGTSLGGLVAQKVALLRPDLVARLVLVSTGHGGRGSERMSLGAMGKMFGFGTLSPRKAARRGLEGATSERYRVENPDEFDRIVEKRLADSPSLASYYEQARAGSRFDASGEVGRISSPTLVIHGAEDRYVPLANARALAEAIPSAKLRVLEGAGHLVFVERAADVNREVVAFLGEGESRRKR